MLSELLSAVLELGLPVAALSWLLFYRLYVRGELARDADRKAIRTTLTAIRKAEKQANEPADSVLHAKWMKFGGGFYGVAALWTLLVIEASGLAGVIAHPSNLEAMFARGLARFIVDWVTGQVGTLVQAALWFSWWPGKGGSPVVWVIVAYAAYIAGLRLARHETGFGSRIVGFDSRARWRSFGAGRDHGTDDQDH